MTSSAHAPAPGPSAPAREVLDAQRARASLAVPALVVLASFAAFAPALRGGFVFDDHLLLQGGGWLARPLWRVWLGRGTADYWPLSYTAFWIEHRLWGDAPLGYHVVNVGLHAATAVLLWRVLSRLRVPGAPLAALLFAVHPAAVESVAWISELKNVLSGALYVGSLACWLRSGEGGGRRSSAASLALFAAALLAKTSTVMLPVVLVGILLARGRRLGRRDVARLAPYFALAAAMGAVTVRFQWSRAMTGTGSGHGLVERLGGAGWALLAYTQHAFLPVNLALLYPRWPVGPGSALYFAPLAVVAAAAVALWTLRRTRARGLALALAYEAILLLPVLGIVDAAWFVFSPIGDHLQYLSLMGPVAAVAAGATALAQRAGPRWRGVAGAALVLLAAARTAVRAAAYRDDRSLWTRAEVEAPQSLKAAWMHAEAVAEDGAPRQALGDLAAAADRFRDPADRHRARAVLLLEERRVGPALREAAAARAERPDAAFEYELGEMLIQASRPSDAVDVFAALLRDAPGSPSYRAALGSALADAGRLPDAAAQLRAACLGAPRIPGTCARYAEVLGWMGRQDAARAEVARALGDRDGDPEVDEVLGGRDAAPPLAVPAALGRAAGAAVDR